MKNLFLILFLLVTFMLSTNVDAASRIFYENFDDGNGDEYSNPGPGVTYITAGAFNGYSASTRHDGYYDETLYHTGWSALYDNEFFVRGHWKWPWQWQPGNGGAKTFHFKNRVSSWDAEILMTCEGGSDGYNTMKVDSYVGGNPILNNACSRSIAQNTWHKFEMYVLDDASDGAIRIWVDDVECFNETGIPTRGPSGKFNWFFTPLNWSNPAYPDKTMFDEIEIYTDIGDEYPDASLVSGGVGQDIVAPKAPFLSIQ